MAGELPPTFWSDSNGTGSAMLIGTELRGEREPRNVGSNFIRERFAIFRPPSRPGQLFLGLMPEFVFPTFGPSGLLPKFMGANPYLFCVGFAIFLLSVASAAALEKVDFPPGPRRISFRRSMLTFAACSGPEWQGQSRRCGRYRDAAR